MSLLILVTYMHLSFLNVTHFRNDTDLQMFCFICIFIFPFKIYGYFVLERSSGNPFFNANNSLQIVVQVE